MERASTTNPLYNVVHPSFDPITMTADAVHPDGRVVTLVGTYALQPGLTWYNETDHHWVDDAWCWRASHVRTLADRHSA